LHVVPLAEALEDHKCGNRRFRSESLLSNNSSNGTTNRGAKVMKKLKTFAVAALAAATLSVGALAAAPSASALPKGDFCAGLDFKAQVYRANAIVANGVGDHSLSAYYWYLAEIHFDMAEDCYLRARIQ
jgi:hypothetical protein